MILRAKFKLHTVVYNFTLTSQGKKYVELTPEDVDQGPGLLK